MPFLHALAPNRCRFITSYGETTLIKGGGSYRLAMACGEPVTAEGASWCAAHHARVFAPALKPIRVPIERATIPRTPEKTPDLCEMIGE